MFYPKQHGPQSSYEELSMLHAQLASAYSIIAQYESEERGRERERLREMLVDRPRKTYGEARRDLLKRTEEQLKRTGDESTCDPMKSSAAHREDEQQ